MRSLDFVGIILNFTLKLKVVMTILGEQGL